MPIDKLKEVSKDLEEVTEATTSTTLKAPLYTRGPYKRGKIVTEDCDDLGLYKTKVRRIPVTHAAEAERYYEFLDKVRIEMKNNFKASPVRSKILENIQGLLNWLKKHIISKENYENTLKSAVDEIRTLRSRIEELENRKDESWSFLNDI